MTFFILSFTSPVFADEKLVLNSGSSDPFITANGGGLYGLLTQEIFRRLDIDAKVIRLTSERALINANNGIEDGNIARIEGLEKKYPNLIRVPEKVVDFEFTAYTRDSDFKVNGWDSFTSYEVGFITGWKIYEKKVTDTKGLTKVRTPEQLFEMADNRRIDIALYERWGGLWWINKLKLNVHALKPAIKTKPMYMYLNRRHKALVPEAARVLSEMKKDGTYQRIYDQTLTYLLNQ